MKRTRAPIILYFIRHRPSLRVYVQINVYVCMLRDRRATGERTGEHRGAQGRVKTYINQRFPLILRRVKGYRKRVPGTLVRAYVRV